ncbi:hypothetical protein GQ44DRAFT_773817 [Phaeosphaeriaceae sp. PMI808]|nr:hypothetical protein GQ44DRAFT_773817 [Phaeosphaeriaceae sp. PMI808]
MKLATTLLLALGALVVATPEQLKIAVNCDSCISRYKSCFENGHTHGQTGCAQTCREHVCHQTAECRNCGGELAKCPTPDKSRYRNACNGPCP